MGTEQIGNACPGVRWCGTTHMQYGDRVFPLMDYGEEIELEGKGGERNQESIRVKTTASNCRALRSRRNRSATNGGRGTVSKRSPSTVMNARSSATITSEEATTAKTVQHSRQIRVSVSGLSKSFHHTSFVVAGKH